MSEETPQIPMPAMVGIREAAAMLGLSERTVRSAVRRGEIPSIFIGGREGIHAGRGLGYRMKTSDLQAWFFGPVSIPDKEEK